MAHESRLTRELHALLQTQRVAALGTLCEDGTPLVSMVPFAIEPGGACLVIHVSGLAAHTHNLQAAPAVSVMVMQAEVQVNLCTPCPASRCKAGPRRWCPPARHGMRAVQPTWRGFHKPSR
jgi:hypothetical protein